ncbi:DUF4064 domain-containing protein [Gammaproteobacteria bacterium]
MTAENAIEDAVGFFIIIVVGSLLSALIGGGFGALVATISPEFITGLFSLKVADGVVRYAFAVGMVFGLFIGSVVSVFVCFLAGIIKILKLRYEYGKTRDIKEIK